MNFFEQQDQSRRQSRWLVVLFILAVLAIISAVNLALLIGFGFAGETGTQVLSATGVRSNWHLIAGGAIATMFWIVDRNAKPDYDVERA